MTHIITLLLLLLLLLFTTTTTIAAASASASASVSWFRENYLKETYNGYYIYTFSRWRLDDNDIDMCPEIHKPSVYFAITGQKLWGYTPLTHATYRQRQREQRRRDRQQRRHHHDYYDNQSTAYYLIWFEITVQDVVWFLIDFYLYCCELLILLISVLMASLTTIILCILVFGQ